MEFGPSDSKDTAKQKTSLAIDIVTPDKAPPSKKTRFADSDEETQESKKSAQSSKSSKTTKSDTPKMALTTQRLKAMTVSTPVRGDGTKTPLRIPPTELQQNRNTTRSSSGTSDTDMEEDDGTIEPLHSLEEVQQALQTLSQRQKHQHESTTKQTQELSQSIIDINYDVESQGRTNAHLIYSKLQTDAKEASMALTIEGFPKEASEDDRKAFASWLLQQAHSKDHAQSISLWNTRGNSATLSTLRSPADITETLFSSPSLRTTRTKRRNSFGMRHPQAENQIMKSLFAKHSVKMHDYEEDL